MSRASEQREQRAGETKNYFKFSLLTVVGKMFFPTTRKTNFHLKSSQEISSNIWYATPNKRRNRWGYLMDLLSIATINFLRFPFTILCFCSERFLYASPREILYDYCASSDHLLLLGPAFWDFFFRLKQYFLWILRQGTKESRKATSQYAHMNHAHP